MQNTALERLAREKHSSLLGPFISYKESKVLWIRHHVFSLKLYSADVYKRIFFWKKKSAMHIVYSWAAGLSKGIFSSQFKVSYFGKPVTRDCVGVKASYFELATRALWYFPQPSTHTKDEFYKDVFISSATDIYCDDFIYRWFSSITQTTEI